MCTVLQNVFDLFVVIKLVYKWFCCCCVLDKNYAMKKTSFSEYKDQEKTENEAKVMQKLKHKNILRYRDSFKTIAELSEEELRLGGLRINPQTNIGSRTTYYNNIKTMNLKDKEVAAVQITGLPENPRLANFSWSPDENKIAFTNPNFAGLYVFDLKKKKTTQITEKQGAGYNPVFSNDATAIFYRANEYDGLKKYSSIYSINETSSHCNVNI